MYTISEYRMVESLDEAAQLIRKSPSNRVIAGSTWLRMGKQRIGTAIDLTRLSLDQIETIGNEIRIGAMTTLRKIETSPLLQTRFDGVLPQCVRSIVGIQFRSCATIGAGVYSRYGFSDPLCALLALDADVEFVFGGRMPLRAYLEKETERDILTYIYIRDTEMRTAWQSFRQTATDFSVLNLCLAQEGGDYRVCVGARPAKAVRCEKAEAYLREGDLQAACEVLTELTYGDNLRGSAVYRQTLSKVLLERAYNALSEVRK